MGQRPQILGGQIIQLPEHLIEHKWEDEEVFDPYYHLDLEAMREWEEYCEYEDMSRFGDQD